MGSYPQVGYASEYKNGLAILAKKKRKNSLDL